MKVALTGGAPVGIGGPQACSGSMARNATDVFWSTIGPLTTPGNGFLFRAPK